VEVEMNLKDTFQCKMEEILVVITQKKRTIKWVT
jgi:hypothetical protein